MDMANKDKPMTQHKQGNFEYLISPQAFLLKTSSRRFTIMYMAPPVVYTIIGKFKSILIDIKRKILNSIFHFNRLKQAF